MKQSQQLEADDRMRPGEYLFVYGTLKRGFGNNRLMEGSEFIRDDRISGAMYSLGGFPGVKMVVEAPAAAEPIPFVSEGPTVRGELYRLTDASDVRSLDRLEGYPSFYGRKRVRTEGGDVTWVYEWNGHEREEDLVPTGNWERANRYY